MSEVSTWDPVDGNNNSAPPNGFPENMAPSGLNDGCRAIMGAVRRWYNTVTAALAALPTTYLSLTGGTLRDGIDIARFDTTGCYNTTGAWLFISDARAKWDIHPYDAKGLQAVLALNPVRFRYLDSDTYRYGLVAQEVRPVVPEMVSVGPDNLLAVNPTHTVFLLINAVKELAQENSVLEARIATLEELAHV
jgi:hypothetical protein